MILSRGKPVCPMSDYSGPETVGNKTPIIVAQIQITKAITSDFRNPILYNELNAMSHTIPARMAAIQPVSTK